MAEKRVLSINIEGKTLHLKVKANKERELKETALAFNAVLLDLKTSNPRLNKEERLILAALNLLGQEKQSYKEAKKALETARTRLQEASEYISAARKRISPGNARK